MSITAVGAASGLLALPVEPLALSSQVFVQCERRLARR